MSDIILNAPPISDYLDTESAEHFEEIKELLSGSGIKFSANKKLVIHKSTFGQDGIQLEYNSGNPRFHIGEGGANATASFIKYENKLRK